MNKIFSVLIASAFLVACNGDQPADANNGASSNNADTNAAKGFSPQEHAKEILNNPVVATENNTESAYKLVTTSKDYSRFGVLVGYSSYAKQLHHEPWVILAPTNLVMDKYDVELVGLLRDPANKSLLDAFIANHIIKSPFSIKKMDIITDAETIKGKKYACSNADQTINGIKLSGVEFYTKMGTVVSVEGLIGFPEAELQKKMAKMKNGEKN